MKHIAMLSGGRDSTAMVVEMLKRGQHLDYVIFTDTGVEFPDMYSYIDEVDKYLSVTYGINITRVSHKRGETFEDWCFGKVTRGKRKGMVRGLPMVTQPCYWKRESKVYPFEKFLKDNNIKEYVQYIGYTYSERKRAQVKDTNQKFPLIDYKMCEADVDKTLDEINLINPLYENFERTGCYFCPYQKLRGFYLLWKLHKDRWDYMVDIEQRLFSYEDRGQKVINSQWNIRYTMMEMERAFESGDILFEVEAPNACECAI